MSTTPDSTTAPRIVYQTPCERVRVERDGPKDYSLYLDGVYTRSFARSWDAEHEGGMQREQHQRQPVVWLHEQTLELAAQLADEAAMRDAARAGALDRDTTFDRSIHTTMRFCPA